MYRSEIKAQFDEWIASGRLKATIKESEGCKHYEVTETPDNEIQWFVGDNYGWGNDWRAKTLRRHPVVFVFIARLGSDPTCYWWATIELSQE